MRVTKESSDIEYTSDNGKGLVSKTLYSKSGKIRDQKIWKNGKRVNFTDLSSTEKRDIPNDFKSISEFEKFMLKVFA